MARVEISPEFIQSVMQSDTVRARLDATAQEAATMAKGIASAEGVSNFEPEVSDGTRPKGRPYSRVSVDKEGDSVDRKLSVLNRVAGRLNAPR